MTLDFWNEHNSTTYDECERINQMIRNFESGGKILSGMIIKDGDYRKNDSRDPFSNRIVNKPSETTKKKPKKKFGKVKGVLTIGGIIGVGYLGYKYIYKPIKAEYDELLDRIIVRSESDKPMNGKIRRLSNLEKYAYDKRFKDSTLILDESQYTISDSTKSVQN